MRSLFLTSLFALSLAATSNLYADTLDLTLTTGASADVLNQVSAGVYTYTHTTDCVLGLGGCTSLLGSTTSVFTATFTQVTPLLTVLNVNDVCTQVVVLGSAPGCQSFAFSATGVTLGDGELGVGANVDVLALLNLGVGLGSAGLTIDGANNTPQLLAAGVHGVGGNIDFTPPPAMAATPEPASLGLLATGILSTAGMIRRKAMASRA
jgi:hypothetical protein